MSTKDSVNAKRRNVRLAAAHLKARWRAPEATIDELEALEEPAFGGDSGGIGRIILLADSPEASVSLAERGVVVGSRDSRFRPSPLHERVIRFMEAHPDCPTYSAAYEAVARNEDGGAS